MFFADIDATRERIDEIMEEEVSGINNYIESVNNALKVIERQINNMEASGVTINGCKEILNNALIEFSTYTSELKNISEQLQQKAHEYKEIYEDFKKGLL